VLACFPVRNALRSSVRAGYAARNMCRACAALGADLQHPCGAEPGFREPHPPLAAIAPQPMIPMQTVLAPAPDAGRLASMSEIIVRRHLKVIIASLLVT